MGYERKAIMWEEGPKLDGFVDPSERWNGFLMPKLNAEQVEELIRATEGEDTLDVGRLRWDDGGRLVFEQKDYREIIEAEWIDVEGGGRAFVWDLGNLGWTWQFGDSEDWLADQEPEPDLKAAAELVDRVERGVREEEEADAFEEAMEDLMNAIGPMVDRFGAKMVLHVTAEAAEFTGRSVDVRDTINAVAYAVDEEDPWQALCLTVTKHFTGGSDAERERK